MANIDLLHEITDSRERHYQIVQEIGSGGTARCYLAKCNGHFYVIKEFWPLNMRALLERKIPNGQLELPRNSSCMFPWYEQQLAYFRTEVDRCSNVNRDASSGENNFPYILHAMHVDGRDDLICVDTEDGFTLYDWVTVHADCWEADYVKSCIALMSRLLQLLQHIHKSWLHLDISPKNIYITAAGHCENFTVSREPNCTVKLFDFASAHEKKLFSEERVYELTSQPTTCTEGFTHPHLKAFGSVLAMAPEKAARYIREHPVDERVDLYSCGATLLYALSHTFPSGRDHITLPAKGILKAPTIREPLIEAIRILMGVTDICRPEDITHHALDTLQAIVAAIDNKAAFNSITARHQCSNRASQFLDEKEAVPELMGQLCIDGTDSGTLVEYAMQQKKPVRLVIRAEQGGAGKTTQMQQLCRQLLSVHAVPFFVPLGDLEKDATKPITQYLCKEYFSTSNEIEKFRALLNDGTAAYWLLLDAVDEVRSGVSLDEELQDLLGFCPNLSVVITSRHQLTLQLQDMVTATLQPLGESLVEKEFPHVSARMKESLRLPMMFRLARDVMKEQASTVYEHAFLSRKDLHIDSEGELMLAYIRCQIQKNCKHMTADEAGKALLSTLPEIAWECETTDWVNIDDFARKYCVEAGILQYSPLTGNTRFIHERWLRFFKAYYIYMLLNISVHDDRKNFNLVCEILINNYLSEDLCTLVGDLTRDYLRVPVMVDGKLCPPVPNEPSMIDKMVNKFCGKENTGYAFSNLFRIMRYARKDDLSLLEVDGADLRKVNLNGVCLSHFVENPQLCAQMTNCSIEEDNLMSKGIANCFQFVVWSHYAILLTKSWKTFSNISSSFNYVECYDQNGWILCDQCALDIHVPDGSHFRSISLEHKSSSHAIISIICSPDIHLMYQVSDEGKLSFLSKTATIYSFIFNNAEYLIPQTALPLMLRKAIAQYAFNEENWFYIKCYYYDKDDNVVILVFSYYMLCFIRVTDGIVLSDTLSTLLSDNNHKRMLPFHRMRVICIVKLASNLYRIHYERYHDRDYEYGAFTYNVETEKKCASSAHEEHIKLSPVNEIIKRVNISGQSFYLLKEYEGSPINADNRIMHGLGLTLSAFSSIFFCENNIQKCLAINSAHQTICFSLYNPQEKQEYPWQVVSLSPSMDYCLYLDANRRHHLILQHIPTQTVLLTLPKDSNITRIQWHTANSFTIIGDLSIYHLQVNENDISIHYTPYHTEKDSLYLKDWTDNRIWKLGNQDRIRRVTGYSGMPNFEKLQKLYLNQGHDFVSFDFDSQHQQYIRRTSVHSLYLYDSFPEKEVLTLTEMATLFRPFPDDKPRFLIIRGCNLRGVKTSPPNRQHLLDILRYNDALVDDE